MSLFLITLQTFSENENHYEKTCFIHPNCKKHLNQNIQKNALLRYTVYHKPVRLNSLTRLDISDVDTVWTYGGQMSTPPIDIYFSYFFPSHIKLTQNNANKDLKSVNRA